MKSTLPYGEIVALKAHLQEAEADHEYMIVVNYPITEVYAVAEEYGINISNTRIVSIPNVTATEVWKYRNALDAINQPEGEV
jgi:hypothetical protein